MNRITFANKRYSKCGYACSLKHLKSLYTFVLADSWATIYSRTCHSVTVGNKFRNHCKIRIIKLLRHFFVLWNFSLADKNCWLDNLDSSARLVRLDWRGTNSRLDKLGWTLRLDRITRQLWQKFSERLSMNFLVNSEFRINLTRLKKRKPIANKRYSKCGFACSLKHLKS